MTAISHNKKLELAQSSNEVSGNSLQVTQSSNDGLSGNSLHKHMYATGEQNREVVFDVISSADQFCETSVEVPTIKTNSTVCINVRKNQNQGSHDLQERENETSHSARPSYQVCQSKLLRIHETVKSSGLPNIRGCRIPLESKWNVSYLEKELVDYEDKEVAQLCKFGWPINISSTEFKGRGPPRNWRSATDFPDEMDRYIQREVQLGTLLGPFRANPFTSSIVISPLSTTEKRDSTERRIIMDLSYPPGDSVNDKIPRDEYLGQGMVLKYPGVDALVALIKKKGHGCALIKVDLRRAFKQILTDPGDWNFLGMIWRDELFF